MMQGISGFGEATAFVPAAFTGVRAWLVKDDGQLRSANFNHVWTDGVNTAVCLPRPTYQGCRDIHPGEPAHVPACTFTHEPLTNEKCGCGFWAYTIPEHYFADGPDGWKGTTTIIPADPWTVGLVRGYGQMRIGPKGFRSTKAVIAALLIPTEADQERVEALRDRYPQVPTFTSLSQMLALMPLTPTAHLLEGETA